MTKVIPVLGRFGRGVHHLYYGLLLMLVAALWIHEPTTFLVVYYLGFVCYLDDHLQHLIQIKHPDYHSPVHNLTVLAYKIPGVKRLNQILDRIFGG